MKDNKKLFVFDIDGTFLNDKKVPQDSTIKVVNELAKLGHILVFATGRTPFQVFDLLEMFNLPFSYILGVNGASIYDIEKETYILDQTKLTKKPIKYLLKIAKKNKREFLYSDGIENWRVYFGNSPREDIKDNDYFIGGTCADPYYDQWENVKQFLFSKKIVQATVKMEKTLTSKYLPIVRKKLSKIVNVFETSKVYIEVNRLYLNKFEGVKKIQELHKISNDYTYCFGDSNNDYDMIRLSGNGIAMGNARDEVKKVAKFIIGNNNEDSIYNFIKQEGII